MVRRVRCAIVLGLALIASSCLPYIGPIITIESRSDTARLALPPEDCQRHLTDAHNAIVSMSDSIAAPSAAHRHGIAMHEYHGCLARRLQGSSTSELPRQLRTGVPVLRAVPRRHGCSCISQPHREPRSWDEGAGPARGRLSLNVVPCPGTLVTVSSPFIPCARSALMARPSPIPSEARVSERSS